MECGGRRCGTGDYVRVQDDLGSKAVSRPHCPAVEPPYRQGTRTVLAGPMDVAASVLSVWASRPQPGLAVARGARSHARTAELGVLYTAVAGMLNLLAIIDSAHRAGNRGNR